MSCARKPLTRPVFIPAYDTEQPGTCLAACRKIARVHRKYAVPGTFFIVGNLLEKEGPEYRSLLDEPELFEIASHTYSHKLLRDQGYVNSPGVSPDQVHDEVFRGKATVEDCFGRECLGLRPGCGFEFGFQGAPRTVAEIAHAGFRYVSSRLWGPHCSVPAPLEQAYTYAADGAPQLWEFPGHGWHENLLKGHNATPGRLLLWPPVYPEMELLHGYVRTPQEEFNVHRFFVDRAVADKVEYVTLIWHPWSLDRFDPQTQMLELLFDYIARQGIGFARFEDLWHARQGAG
ncbi:MAG: hypothetical protein A3K19_04180 [Lentisphaerae bacterium RIFOXYB12_FULL_65_16]|nr:MAG: hypothetical protein A3K18_09520 [Lentisphaerae bacterium RIFOXYA12_64_32]OGV84282.1 MAG: hypothetical protein A3K19_04180 [Lentisphaerae bacterium RIFOXYB12_FULL_65_16]